LELFGPYAHIPLIKMDHMLKIGYVPNWTDLFILVDEDWSYSHEYIYLKDFIKNG